MNRRWVVCTTILVIAAGCQPSPSASTGPRSLSGILVDASGRPGSEYRIDVPPAWNATLVLYSHGTIVAPPGHQPLLGPPALTPDDGLQPWFLTHGYALAAASYARPTGWAVEDAIRDQLALLDRFEKTVGKPKRVIVWGESQGGLDSVLLLERHPDRLAGGISLCGLLGGGVDYFNHDLDMFFALDVLLAPGMLIHAGAPTLADIDSRPAEAIIDTAQASPAGQARLALTAAIQDFPTRFTSTDGEPPAGDWQAFELRQVEWIRFQLGTSFRADVELKSAGNPSSNTGVDYGSLLHRSPYSSEVTALYRAAGLDLDADLAKLAAAPRISADSAAVRYMTEFGEPSGHLSRPLLTMHTTDDGRVIPSNERFYADLVSRQGRPGTVRQLFVSRGGHCAFSDAEIIAGFEVLVHRLDTGTWPETSPGAMNALAAGAGTRYAHSAPLEYQIPSSGQFVAFDAPPLPR